MFSDIETPLRQMWRLVVAGWLPLLGSNQMCVDGRAGSVEVGRQRRRRTALLNMIVGQNDTKVARKANFFRLHVQGDEVSAIWCALLLNIIVSKNDTNVSHLSRLFFGLRTLCAASPAHYYRAVSSLETGC